MNIKKTLLSILIGVGTSTIAAAIYTILLTLHGKGFYFHVKLLFSFLTITGGMVVFYILYKKEKETVLTSAIYGVFTSVIIFFLIGFINVNLYGA